MLLYGWKSLVLSVPKFGKGNVRIEGPKSPKYSVIFPSRKIM
jgi:hypothetical protein